MSDVTVVRWRKFGKDRLYVNGPGEQRLGWCDLLTGAVDCEDEHHRSAVEAAVDAWRATQEGSASATGAGSADTDAPASARTAPHPASTRTSGTGTGTGTGEVAAKLEPAVGAAAGNSVLDGALAATDGWEDLSDRRAGQEAREQAVALRQAAPVRTFFARVLGVHTDERAWRVGADGEEMVAAQLAKLVRRDPRWRVLHAVPVGDNGSDIDHVVIGPPGVFTLNAKHHPGAKIWVAGNTFKVNGQNRPYVRNSRHEAQRTARLLTGASGMEVEAVGVVVPVGAAGVVIKAAPDGAHVVTRKGLVKWLETQPPSLDAEAVDRIFTTARRSTTWRANK